MDLRELELNQSSSLVLLDLDKMASFTIYWHVSRVLSWPPSICSISWMSRPLLWRLALLCGD